MMDQWSIIKPVISLICTIKLMIDNNIHVLGERLTKKSSLPCPPPLQTFFGGSIIRPLLYGSWCHIVTSIPGLMFLKIYFNKRKLNFRSDSPLATLYSTSTMEHHHFDQCIMILSSEVGIKIRYTNCTPGSHSYQENVSRSGKDLEFEGKNSPKTRKSVFRGR